MIPAYKVRAHVLDVISRIGPEVKKIWVIDDFCPDNSGALVESNCSDARVKVVFHDENIGVGGATITGYKHALSENADIVVKVDGDGQMHPEEIPKLVAPVVAGDADYTKGNRFDSVSDLRKMPVIRLLGNGVLSLMSKISTGYWSVNDPTNGFTAIHRSVLQDLEPDKLSKRYFFESDLLFRLNLVNAVVRDVSIPAQYGNEKSSLKIYKVLLEFPAKHFRNQLKRVIYRYYLREWSVGSLELASGLALVIFGATFGITSFLSALERSEPTTAGQVSIASLAIILGFQLLLSFLNYDIQSEPRLSKTR